MKTFTLNSGNTYTEQDNGYCFAVINGKKTRCSAAAVKMAYEQFAKEENARQNATNEFTNIDPLLGAAEDPTISVEEYRGTITEEDIERDARELERYMGKVEETKEAAKVKKIRKSKDIAYTYSENGETVVTLTAKQVDFVKHLSDTCFWENGLESCVWVDCLCDEIGGQFAGKPMTVGAMISTLCEKGLGIRAKQKVNGRKCTSFELTDLGKTVFATGWGLE